MGLIMGLLTLPLAPVRGTVWIAEKLEEQAEAELYDETAIRSAMEALEAERQAGTISDEELAAAEDELIQRLMELRGFAQEEAHGGF
jgi:hypothetical protein